MQCAQYFPEDLNQKEAYGSWQVHCTSVREVDSDVSRRDLLVTPPAGSGVRDITVQLTLIAAFYSLLHGSNRLTFDEQPKHIRA